MTQSLILNDVERRARLAQTVNTLLAQGYREEGSRTEFSTILVQGNGVSAGVHILHLVMTLVTAGLWIIVWFLHIMSARVKRRLVAVDEFGNVSVQVVKQG